MPKYREKPIKPKEVEAIQYTGFDMLDEILEFSTLSDFEVYDRNTGLERIVLKNGLRRINLELRTGYYLVKNRDNGNINLKVYKQREFEKKFESVDSAKKARKMAELSGMLTKNGFDFTEKESEIDNNEMARGKLESLKRAFEDGRIKSSSVTNLPVKDNYGQWQFGESVYTFHVEPSAIAKEFIAREVLPEIPVTVSLDGKEIAEACAKSFTKSMRRDMRSK
ncbi:hypothetical protein CHH92_20875 [Bacillus sonorensis]|uniref:hypothetical protein n=1 Tax=Bacillus sonorensis TaxID=119858 RepID=UPI000BA7D825|nr:hypothetical protein [Bacillus sonorensis]PAD58250.1 hypothetical protein CHH92_20875 [Bacillus sonorensis]